MQSRDFVSIGAEMAAIPPKSIDVYFTNPVVEATCYNHVALKGVHVYRKEKDFVLTGRVAS
ncbi:hypothetical protein GCM10027284_16090 [Cyclobacterium sediminis]